MSRRHAWQLIGMGLLLFSSSQTTAAEKPNLVVFICDDLGRLVDDLLAGDELWEVTDRFEEFLHVAGGLVEVDDSRGSAAGGRPDVRCCAGDEDGLAGASAEALFADFEIHLAVDDVDPFVLVMVQVAGPAGGELEDSHGAMGVLAGHLAIDGGPAEVDGLIEAVLSRGDGEAGKHFAARHFLSPG